MSREVQFAAVTERSTRYFTTNTFSEFNLKCSFDFNETFAKAMIFHRVNDSNLITIIISRLSISISTLNLQVDFDCSDRGEIRTLKFVSVSPKKMSRIEIRWNLFHSKFFVRFLVIKEVFVIEALES